MGHIHHRRNQFLAGVFGAVALAGLAALCLRSHGHQIPKDISARAGVVLETVGLDPARLLSVDGRDIILHGEVDRMVDRSRLLAMVQSVRGVRTVSDRLTVNAYFLMTGWRLGWLVAPAWALDGLERLAHNLYLAAPTPAQHAALAAFSAEALSILEARKAELKARRDFLLPALRGLGFELPVTPQGAFYLYADCRRHTRDSFQFARNLLDEVGVAITPGLDFGHHQPGHFVRFAYTQPLNRLAEAIDRISQFLQT